MKRIVAGTVAALPLIFSMSSAVAVDKIPLSEQQEHAPDADQGVMPDNKKDRLILAGMVLALAPLSALAAQRLILWTFNRYPQHFSPNFKKSDNEPPANPEP